MHNRQSTRLKGYDYSREGLYFVTICTHDRECLFGEIVVGAENFPPIMKLNDAGTIANECWLEIPQHFPNAILHEHIVMPNHVHGIIELKPDAIVVGAENFPPKSKPNDAIVRVENFQPLPDNPGHTIGAENFLPLHPQHPQKPQQNEFQKMIPRSIGSIVKGFKIGVTIRTKNILPDQKIWQRNYHDHIIRNAQSYLNISNYIINNPGKWKDDKFYE